MKLRSAKILVALMVSTLALVGCTGPTANRADLDQLANDTLDVAEQALPAIASNLGAELTRVGAFPERGGGMEGTAANVTFVVWGNMSGGDPTQAQLEGAVLAAGFAPVTDGQASEWPAVTALSADGRVSLEISYAPIYENPPEITFSMRSVDTVNVSNGTVNDFRNTFGRGFDQDLVP